MCSVNPLCIDVVFNAIHKGGIGLVRGLHLQEFLDKNIDPQEGEQKEYKHNPPPFEGEIPYRKGSNRSSRTSLNEGGSCICHSGIYLHQGYVHITIINVFFLG